MSFVADRLSRIKASPVAAMTRKCEELQRQGRDIIQLNFGEPDFFTADHVAEAGIRAIREHNTKYTAIDGSYELKQAIAAKLKRENGIDYAPEQVIVASGGKMVLYNALLATVNPGDEVIIPAPYWVSYPDMVKLAEGVPVFVSCPQNNGFRMRLEDLAAAITKQTRMLILNTPSNPTGAAYSRDDLTALARVLLDHPQVIVLTDEIYEHIVYDGFKPASMAAVEPRLYDRTITMNGMSKGYFMTGWRIGFAAGPKEIVKAMATLTSQNVSCPNTISQVAAIEALNGPDDYLKKNVAVFKERRDMAVAQLNKCAGLSCHKPEGAFYVYPSCAGTIGKRTPGGKRVETDADFVMGLLEAEGVAAVHGEAFGLSPYFRISYALATADLQKALDRIHRFCASLR
ncbi:MAG: pyridoxal phosphate-dependent aminotransferase [Rhodospirillales bacterium]|nr:pyridoxal phosphate-dependent aminotransferase [Rhodospirillales bacterium]